MDTIIIRDLAVAYHVGVTEAERAQPQRLLLSLEIGRDLAAAADADDLSQTIDYYAVCQRLLHFGEGRKWKLIETLAYEIAALVRTEFLATAVSVEVKKFVITEAAYVAVRVAR
jgi:7,8-dihydroneopterin aldolase/epimerase/oxygenase